MKVSGYLKGPTLDVNGLVHVSWLGDFQMAQIVIEDDPFAPDRKVFGCLDSLIFLRNLTNELQSRRNCFLNKIRLE